jgi:hypothetical protein
MLPPTLPSSRDLVAGSTPFFFGLREGVDSGAKPRNDAKRGNGSNGSYFFARIA